MIFTRCLTVGCVMMSGLTATSNAHTSRRSSLHLVRTASCSVRLQALPSLVRTSSLSAMESSTSPADPHAVRMMSIWSPADSAAASRASTSSRSDMITLPSAGKARTRWKRRAPCRYVLRGASIPSEERNLLFLWCEVLCMLQKYYQKWGFFVSTKPPGRDSRRC